MKKILLLICGTILLSCSNSPTVNFTVTTSQQITPVLIGNATNIVLKIKVDVNDTQQSSLTSLELATNGTTNINDIDSVTVYYTGNSASFLPYVLSAPVQKSGAQIKINTHQILKQGANYFWVTAKLSSNANIQNTIDVQCSKVTVNKTSVVPTDETPNIINRIGHAVRNRGSDGIEAFRIPGLVTTKKGTLIAVYDIRYNNSKDLQEDIDIGINRSTDGGQTWLPMQNVMDMGEWGGLSQAENGVGDPCILVDQTSGRIWIAALWAHGYKNTATWLSSKPGMEPAQTGQFLLAYSDDDGLTWSEPINITKQIKKPEWHLLLQGPGKGISMKNGTLVFPAQYKDKNEMPYSTIIYSTDKGETWHIGAGARSNTTEAQVIEIEDNVLMLNMRDNRGGSRAVSITKNLGKTWEEHPSNRSALRESVCMASLIKVDADKNASGKEILFFSNPDTEKDRHSITIKASFDGGLTWATDKQVLLDTGHGWGYSCLTMIDENTVGILYESSVAHMTFQAIKLSDIIGDK